MRDNKPPRGRLAAHIRRGTAILALSACVVQSGTTAVQALGGDDYVGSIALVGFPFCPLGTAEAWGQLVSVNDLQLLYAVIGNTYGGDKSNGTFRLPDLRDEAPADGMRYCIVIDGRFPTRN